MAAFKSNKAHTISDKIAPATRRSPFDYSWISNGKEFPLKWIVKLDECEHWAENKARVDLPLKSLKVTVVDADTCCGFELSTKKPRNPHKSSNDTWTAFLQQIIQLNFRKFKIILSVQIQLLALKPPELFKMKFTCFFQQKLKFNLRKWKFPLLILLVVEQTSNYVSSTNFMLITLMEISSI